MSYIDEHQVIWLGADATSFEGRARRAARSGASAGSGRRLQLDVQGTLRAEADVGFTAAAAGTGSGCAGSRGCGPSRRRSGRRLRPLAGCAPRSTPAVPATVIVGAQWGDEGKGKIVDLLAQDSDLVCRYNGGPNAGHTIVADGETYKLRHMPSGILWGKECVIGAGCVVDPGVFIEELDEFESRGISTELGRGSRGTRT